MIGRIKKALGIQRLYEHDKANPRHPYRRTGPESGNATIEHTRGRLRESARWLIENHDVAVSALETMLTRIVGPGTTVEPMITNRAGELNEAVNERVRRLWHEWLRNPDTTGELSGIELERLAVTAWLVDGEVFAEHVGEASAYDFQTPVPYAVQLIEADLCPYDEIVQTVRSVHGVERDQWGRPTGYLFYIDHPGDHYLRGATLRTRLAPAANVLHLKNVRRIGQVRGVSRFHAVIDRMLDIHHLEDSELIAARVGSQMTAYVKRDVASAMPDGLERDGFMLEAGSTFELAPGEDVGLISANRPNPNLAEYIQEQIKRVAGGLGAQFSTVSRTYQTSYSAQRQELIDAEESYKVLRQKYYADFLQPIYRRFMQAAIAQGVLPARGIDPESIFDVWMRGPSMPWIDPLKEANANKVELEIGVTSRHDVMRARGKDPNQVDKERSRDPFTGTAPASNQPPQEDANDDEQAA